MADSFTDSLAMAGYLAWAHSLLLAVPLFVILARIEVQEYKEWRAAHPEGFHFNFHLPHRHARV